MVSCVICLQLLLVMTVQRYLVQCADFGDDGSEIKSLIESIGNEVNNNKHERYERIAPTSQENYHTYEGRGRRTKRDWTSFKQFAIEAWNKFLTWFVNSWQSLMEAMKKAKF